MPDTVSPSAVNSVVPADSFALENGVEVGHQQFHSLEIAMFALRGAQFAQ
jgi:hypothetical protein